MNSTFLCKGGIEMHSKVIIASLVCLMAASFGDHGIFKDNKQTKAETENVTGCAAPNDSLGVFEDQYYPLAAGYSHYIWYDTPELFTDFDVLDSTPGLGVSIESRWDYGCEIRFDVSTASGEFYAVFGRGTKEVATMYVYSDGVDAYFSGLSMEEAKSRYFFDKVATSSELDYLQDYEDIPSQLNSRVRNKKASKVITDNEKLTIEQNSLIADAGVIVNPKFPKDIVIEKPVVIAKTYEPTKFDAQKHFGDFVFGESDDIYTRVETTRRTGSSVYDDVEVNIYAEWFDSDGNSHPLKGIKTDLLSPQNTSLAQEGTSIFTNDDGVYTTHIPYNQAKNLFKDEVQFRLSAISKATYVQDRHYLSYPYCYSNKEYGSTTYINKLYNFSKIDFHVSVFPGRSDRSNAYEICQAQALPYNYCEMLGSGIDAVRTEYPAAYTEYKDFRQQSYIIRVNDGDYNNWDLLNHEYGHYISDKYQAAHYFQDKKEHFIFDDLIETYDEWDGPVLAYTEGLATYFAIASQLYCDPGSTIPGVANEIYEDARRGAYVDYSGYSPASAHSSNFRGEGVEANITSFLLKLRDNTYRPGDNVAFGDQGMWDLLTSGYSMNGGYNPYTTTNDFIEWIISQKPAKETAILNLAGLEKISFVPTPPVVYEPLPDDVWTILIYVCGSNLQKNAIADIKEMVKTKKQPDDVNIVLEIGGSKSWPQYDSSITFSPYCLNRYYIEGNQLHSLPSVANANMGASSTFENFLEWGMTNYPAKKTGVILWDHGGGLGGVCFDDNYYGDGLTSPEMATAIENVFGRKGISNKLEFVGYDACLMQVQDVAEFNSKYFKHMVASEELEPVSGWDYDGWLPLLYEKGKTADIMKKICTTYIGGGLNFDTLSHLNLAYMDTYKNSFEALATAISSTALANKEQFLFDFFHVKEFNYGKSGLADGYDFLNNLKADPTFKNFKTQIENTKTAYKNLVAYNKTGWWFTGEAHGLSIYYGFTYNGTNKLDYDANRTHFTKWRNLIDQVTTGFNKNALAKLILGEIK